MRARIFVGCRCLCLRRASGTGEVETDWRGMGIGLVRLFLLPSGVLCSDSAREFFWDPGLPFLGPWPVEW